MTYKIEDLLKLSRIYNKVFYRLCQTLGTIEHRKWLKRERTLNKIEMFIKKKYGIVWEMKDLCSKWTRWAPCSKCFEDCAIKKVKLRDFLKVDNYRNI
jgi:hypothetical protein